MHKMQNYIIVPDTFYSLCRANGNTGITAIFAGCKGLSENYKIVLMTHTKSRVAKSLSGIIFSF